MTPAGILHQEARSIWDSRQLWSPWEMILTYLPIYEISAAIYQLNARGHIWQGGSADKLHGSSESIALKALLEKIETECSKLGIMQTAALASRILKRPSVISHTELFNTTRELDESLRSELEAEAIIRVPPARKQYFENDQLFGTKVSEAFPSCERDIRNAGNSYALEQPEASVHHLMLVLERGLNALANKVQVPFQRTNWQNIIEQVGSKIRGMRPSTEKAFYLEVNAQFGFLKDAYRNHAEHAHDYPCDMERALSVLNHVRTFMQELANGGLSE